MPHAIGLISGSSLDGLDIAYVDFSSAGKYPTEKWAFSIVHAETVPYSADWVKKLSTANQLDARSYLLLHTAYGHYLGQCVNRFIAKYNLELDDIDLVASHGHTVFHEPWNSMTGQIGDGAAICAETRLLVVNDLRSMDVAYGGQGAPIVPIGEKYLFDEYRLLLNIGGIANITDQKYHIAFDICPANRILNKLVEQYLNKEYDENGELSSTGEINEILLNKLNQLDYYKKIYPKSLSNSFGLDIIYPLLEKEKVNINDLLRTYVEHIIQQISNSIQMIIEKEKQDKSSYINCKILITGGGAHNTFLFQCLQRKLKEKFGIKIEYPVRNIVDFKEALIMAFIGLLRIQKKANVLASVTGAKRDTIGGAVWSN
jgi:anhydro-N-acetylmuramic acid kinase